jgi:colanic acid/amylovoran biosynthesis glycosyltransferase
MRVAYLVNQYPAVSHTFIRREIAGLEACGVEVLRYSIRPVDEKDLADEVDRAERSRTETLLGSGLLPPAGALLVSLLLRPWRTLRALALAWRLGGRSNRGRLRHLAYLAEAALLARRVRARGADHLHAHFGTNSATVVLLCRLLGGPPYSFTVHGPEDFDRPEVLGLREKVREAAFVVAVSEYSRSQVMRGVEPAEWPKLRVIRCGVDRPFLDGAAPGAVERPRLVCVGRLSKDKGHLLLLEAAGRLAREGLPFELVLVGDGDFRPSIEARIGAEGLSGRVRLTGSLDGGGVRREILEARCLVLPSLVEGLPVVLMEAMSLGRPVISTYVGGIPELVVPGVNGWLVPAGSVEDLTAAMRDALSQPAGRLQELGRAGRERVLAAHDAAKEAARLAELYRNGSRS